ncbi:MAG: GNAT family N-acetyltransferase [bacterium]|nr:GNAT family N-acetyltransferase [bacterium]
MAGQYWTIRQCTPHDDEAVHELVHVLYPEWTSDHIRSYWQWRYPSVGPFRAEVIAAEHDGRLIGIQPMAVFEYQWGDERCRGAMYTGVMTHPDHQRRGVFRSLIDAANAQASAGGSAFSMTLPNDASQPGFVRSGEWNYPGVIPLYVKVLDGAALLRPRVGRMVARALGWAPGLWFKPKSGDRGEELGVEQVDAAPEDLDAVFEAFAHDCGTLMIRRTAAYWNWRHASPRSSCRMLAVRDGGSLAGMVVTTSQPRMGMEVGMVVDLVARGGVGVLRRLLHEAEIDLRSRGLGIIACQASTPLMRTALEDEGYRYPGTRWVPKRFHFVYRPTGGGGLLRDPQAMSDWHLTFGDSDNV